MNPLRLSRILSLLAYFGLLAHVLVWAILANPNGGTATLLLLAGMPLLIFLRGLLYGRAKTHAWLGIVSLLYFIHGTAEAYSNESARILAYLEVGLSLLLFFATALYARLYSQQNQPSH
jgi:uncharacterized membrane protein